MAEVTADPIRGSGRVRVGNPTTYPAMAMGTKQAAATAAVAGGVRETTVRSPEAVHRPAMEATTHPMGSPAATIGAYAEVLTEDHLEEAQGAIPEADPVPGLAPGTATATAESGKSRTK